MIIIFVIIFRFADFTEDEIIKDRYLKFRSIGMFEKFTVPAGQW